MNYTLGMFTFQVCDLRDSFTHIYKLYTDKQWTLQNTDKSVGQETQTWRNLKIIKCYLVNASLYFSTIFWKKKSTFAHVTHFMGSGWAIKAYGAVCVGYSFLKNWHFCMNYMKSELPNSHDQNRQVKPNKHSNLVLLQYRVPCRSIHPVQISPIL